MKWLSGPCSRSTTRRTLLIRHQKNSVPHSQQEKRSSRSWRHRPKWSTSWHLPALSRTQHQLLPPLRSYHSGNLSLHSLDQLIRGPWLTKCGYQSLGIKFLFYPRVLRSLITLCHTMIHVKHCINCDIMISADENSRRWVTGFWLTIIVAWSAFSDVMLSTIITIYQLLRRMNTQTYCDYSVVILLKSKHYHTAKSIVCESISS